MSGEFESLLSIPAGLYQCCRWWQFNKSDGWIDVRHNDNDYDNKIEISWTTHKDHNQPLDASATIVYINQLGDMTMYAKTYLSLHMIWGYGRRDKSDKEEGLNVARRMKLILDRLVREGVIIKDDSQKLEV